MSNKRIAWLLLLTVLVMGVIFGTTRLEYMGEVNQLDFYIQQNQNLGRYNVKMFFELHDKVTKLENENAALKAENLLRDEYEAELLDSFLVLEESHRMLKADVAMLTLYGELLHKLLMDHLNPGPAPDQNPWRDI